MGYQIRYDDRTNKYEVKTQNGTGMLMFCLFVVMFSSALCVSPGVRAWVIPGEDAVTVQAFSAMTDDLRSGADILDAFETFCRMVVHGQ